MGVWEAVNRGLRGWVRCAVLGGVGVRVGRLWGVAEAWVGEVVSGASKC